MEVLQKKGMLFLRLSLGVVFLWFGVLKLFTISPSLLAIQNTLPIELASSQVLSFGISIFEMLLGISFLINKLDRIAATAAFVYLSLTTVLLIFTQGFEPRFPVLSLIGESAVKNLVLISSCLVLLSDVTKENKLSTSKPQNIKK